MTLAQFLDDFKFEFQDYNLGGVTYVAITRIIRRSDNKVMSSVRTVIDIFEMNTVLSDSQQPFSLTPWDWNKLIEETKRNQLEYFTQRIPLEDFYPLNSATDISPVYI